MSHIAFLGAGLIGSGMIEAALGRGLSVRVHNRTREKAEALAPLGASVADTVADAVRGAARVHLALSDDAAVDAALDAASEALADGTPVVDHSTTSPAGVRARVARRSRVRFVHAPVFMSPSMCKSPAGIMLVSGARDRVDAVRGELTKMTGKLLDLGERPDLAATYKLFGNAMIFALVGGIADVLAMARAEDVDPAAALGLFDQFQVANVIALRGKRMAAGDFAPSFHLAMARKDIGLMMDVLAAAPGGSAVLGALADRFDRHIAAGQGDLDVGVVATPP